MKLDHGTPSVSGLALAFGFGFGFAFDHAQPPRSKPGSLAMFAAILLASSFVSSLAAIANIWEQPMPLGCSSDGGNRLGEDHDKIDTDRFSCGLVAGRSYVCHGSKWSTHWRISSSAVEPQSLRLLSLSLLSSSLLRPLSSSLSSLSSLSRLLSLLRDSATQPSILAQ